MERVGDIIIGAVGATALLAACVLVLRLSIQGRWQHILWGFKVAGTERPKIVIETIEGERTAKYKRPSAGFGAVAAVAKLSTALNASRSGVLRRLARSLEHPIELRFSKEQEADTWCSSADTVIVGGPKSNEKTAELLRAFGCQLPGTETVDEDELKRLTGQLHQADRAAAKKLGVGDATYWYAGSLGVATQENAVYWFGEKFEGDVGEADDPLPGSSGYKGTDYGVVLRLPSATIPAHRSVVLFGSQTFGVDAASSWLVQLRSHGAGRKVRSIMAKHKNIAALVMAEVEDGELRNLTLKELVVLPGDLTSRDWGARP